MQMMAANYYSSSRPQTKIRNNLLVIERRPLMQLRDYLSRDDLSSCSSSGFKSFPRRQCCSTIRFLLDKDLKTNPNPHPPFLKRRSRTLSTLHKAVINAVKLLPFPSSSSQRRSLLPRSFSRKLFKKSFWKKSEREENDGEIRRWRLFKDFLQEEQMQHSNNNSSNSNNNSNNSNVEVITSSSSTSTIWSNNVSKSESWGESEFTVGDSQNDVVEVKVDAVDDRVAAVVGGNSDQSNAKEWRNEEKEQFSPVSVLECPFEDDQEDSSSPFQCSLVRIEGTKQKLMKKIRKFENIVQIEPVDLDRRIAQADSSDDEDSVNSSTQSCSVSNDNEENGAEIEACKLVELVKTSLPPDTTVTKIDKLLLDFFKEKITENKSSNACTLEKEENRAKYEKDFQVVREWINGQPQEMFLGWEVKENRPVYVKDMERSVKWRSFDKEKEEVTLQLEHDILSSLLDEALFDMF